MQSTYAITQTHMYADTDYEYCNLLTLPLYVKARLIYNITSFFVDGSIIHDSDSGQPHNVGNSCKSECVCSS